MEATHSTVQWAMSEHWHYVDSKSEENPQSRLEATDLFSVDMRAGDIQIEPKVSNLSAGWHRSERSNPVSQLSIVDERTGVALSGRMQCQSIWLVQKNSIFPFANKYDLWGMCSFFFSVLWTLPFKIWAIFSLKSLFNSILRLYKFPQEYSWMMRIISNIYANG